MELPVKQVNRAKQLWLEPVNGKKRTFADVAALLNNEFHGDITRQTIQKWAKQFGWTVGATAEVQRQALDAAMTPASEALTLPARELDEEDKLWEWEKRKLKFLAMLAGVAEDCFTVARAADADGVRLAFRDAESALKTGMAAMELLGKINSGKHDDVAAGDRIPALSEAAVAGVVNFFINVEAPTPDIRPVLTIDVEADVADRN